MKTSKSQSFQIKTVEAGNGEIDLTFFPGKKQQMSFDGPWDRDLDLEEIQAWGGVALVALLEDHEFRERQVPELGEKSETMGPEWYHLLIKGLYIPREPFERTWKYSYHRLRMLLQGSEKSVLHCMGGLERPHVENSD